MPVFAANLSTMFQELPVLSRPAAAHACGFRAIEFQWPYAEDILALPAVIRTLDLEVALINMPPGNLAGDRGIAAVPGRQEDFIAAFARALDWAEQLRSRHVRVVCGYLPDTDARTAMESVLIENLRAASPLARKAGVSMLLEPLNAFDQPGYLLETTDRALDLIVRTDIEDLSLQLDLYHVAMSGCDPLTETERLAGRYGHIQISDVPGRNEPGTGKIDFAGIFGLVDRTGYTGLVGCEYTPSTTDTRRSLSWGSSYGLG